MASLIWGSRPFRTCTNVGWCIIQCRPFKLDYICHCTAQIYCSILKGTLNRTMIWFRLTKCTVRTLVCITVTSSLLEKKIKFQPSFLLILCQNLCEWRNFQYFCDIHSMKLLEISYVRSMAPTNCKLLHFLLIGSYGKPTRRFQNFLRHCVSCRNLRFFSLTKRCVPVRVAFSGLWNCTLLIRDKSFCSLVSL